MQLTSWGWTPQHQQEFDRVAQPGLVPARVARQDRTGWLVAHEGGDAFARITGRLKDDPPVVGDWVALDLTDPPTLRALLPRRTAFVRTAAGRETRAQVVAANVDVALLVAGLDGDLSLRRLERYLVLAAQSGARPVVVLNKADLRADRDEVLREVVAVARGADVLVVSARTGEGVDALRALVPAGVTAVLLGSSGVGKSSLANALLGAAALPTAEVRAHDSHGRHTTSARHLLPLPGGGCLLDTPGMRELQLTADEGGLREAFGEVEELALRCRFRDCGHETEPGCAVRDAVPPERLAAWRKLQRETAAQARRADVASERAESRKWGRMHRNATEGKRRAREW